MRSQVFGALVRFLPLELLQNIRSGSTVRDLREF